MNAKIIFYSAKKTALCEKALKKRFSELGFKAQDSVFATDAKGLGVRLSEAFGQCGAVFTVGGLGFADRRNAAGIVAGAAAGAPVELIRRFQTGGDDGYLLRAGNQLLVMLPDEPEQLERALHSELGGYLHSYVNQLSRL